MNQNVLAIDDSPDVHHLLDVRLRPEGLILHHALDATQGLAMAVDLGPDLILLDVDLPHVTGFEVCKKLKDNPATAQIPIIFLTGATEVYSKVQGFDLGAVDYVTKPFDPAELRARVRAALRVKRYHDILAARSHGNRRADGRLEPLVLQPAHRRGVLRGEEVWAHDLASSCSTSITSKDSTMRTGIPSETWSCRPSGISSTPCFARPTRRAGTGAEEFAFILTETDLDGAKITAERLRREKGAVGGHVSPAGQGASRSPRASESPARPSSSNGALSGLGDGHRGGRRPLSSQARGSQPRVRRDAQPLARGLTNSTPRSRVWTSCDWSGPT